MSESVIKSGRKQSFTVLYKSAIEDKRLPLDARGLLAIMVGLFQGGVQALSRSYFGRIIPKEKSNEYYGFFDIFGRYASVMGTFLVSVVTSLTGNPSLGVLSIGVLLIVGFMLLVRLSRMTRAAEHAA